MKTGESEVDCPQTEKTVESKEMLPFFFISQSNL